MHNSPKVSNDPHDIHSFTFTLSHFWRMNIFFFHVLFLRSVDAIVLALFFSSLSSTFWWKNNKLKNSNRFLLLFRTHFHYFIILFQCIAIAKWIGRIVSIFCAHIHLEHHLLDAWSMLWTHEQNEWVFEFFYIFLRPTRTHIQIKKKKK